MDASTMADPDKPMTGTADSQPASQPESQPQSQTPAQPQDTFIPFTLEERISQLCEIDKDIVSLMSHTAQALGALGPQPPTTTLSAQLTTFKSHMDSLLSTLHDVDVHMKRQILGLEEAGIIRLQQRAGPQSDASNPAAGAAPPSQTTASQQSAGGAPPRPDSAMRASLEPNGVGSIGALDVGWLNSRNSKVERDMEAELWGKMRRFLEDYEKTGDKGDAPAAQES